MPRYGVLWVQLAREQYATLPPAVQDLVDARVGELLEDPRHPPRPGYDQRTDQWTTTYGAGAGLILFAVVDARQRVIILRLV